MSTIGSEVVYPVDAVVVEPEISDQEKADQKRWNATLQEARKFDEPARAEMARNRKYARGDSSFAQDANIANTYIGILTAFLFAKNPDMDIQPAKSTEPPDTESIREAAMSSIPPEVQQQAALAGQLAQAIPLPTGDPMMPAAPVDPAAAQQAVIDEYVNGVIKKIQDRFAKRQRDNKAFAETCELVAARMWKDAGLKSASKKWVRSALSVGVGVMKAAWQERTAPDPKMVKMQNDLQDNIKRVTAMRLQIESGESNDLDAEKAEYERQLQALAGKTERVIARGFATDFLAAEDWQGALGYTVSANQDMPWQAHRFFILKTDAMAEYGLSKDRLKKATNYVSRPIVMQEDQSASLVPDGAIKASDADAFTSGTTTSMEGPSSQTADYLCGWEIWDRGSNSVLTMIEGVEGWVKPPWQPKPTTRFFPFFLFTIADVDGQRWPQSLISSSYKQLDEYNSISTQEAIHRKRILPKSIANGTNLSPKDAKAIADGVVGEIVVVMPTMPDTDVRTMVVPVSYPPMDPMLYDKSGVRNEIEMSWGVQEALAGGVTNDKTATEAEIQQSGFQARTGGRRDDMEASLNELALYTVEVARANMSDEDVIAICGPDAFWPAYDGAESLAEMLNVEIQAGSSGKPNTNRDREAWAGILPLLQQTVKEVGLARRSRPEDIADSLIAIAQITVDKYGERIDVDSMMPKLGPPPMPGEPALPGDANGSV